MAWTKLQAKRIRHRELTVSLNKWIRRKFQGCSRTAFVFNADGDTDDQVLRISAVKATPKIIKGIARTIIVGKRLRIKMPEDIIHLFDLLFDGDEIHFPYLNDVENRIVRYRAEGRSLPDIARAMSGGNRGLKRNRYTAQQIRYILQKIRNKIREYDPNIHKTEETQIDEYVAKTKELKNEGKF